MFGANDKRTARRQSASLLLAAATALTVLFTASAAEASDTTKGFQPVRTTERSLVFKIRGVEAKQIVAAKALIRAKRRSKPVERQLNIARIRSVTSHNRLLTVRKPSSARGGKLLLSLSGGPESGTPPTSTPSPERSSSCGWGTFSASVRPSACWRPYADSSSFNTPVAGKPVASNSAAIVSRLMGLATTPDKITTGNADTETDWAHPIYYSQASDPLFTVDCVEAWGTCEIEGMKLRIPNQARAAGGSDGHMSVIDQAAGWEYDFWQVRSKPQGGGTISISWGGRTRIGTADADGLATGATAANFGLAAGVIRPAELAAGEINHALFTVVKCTSGASVAPAAADVGRPCSSIGLSNANAPAMGQHFYLDMSVAEINALAKPAWQKTILRAMARYGTYVGDTGGSGWGLMFESGSSYTSFGQADPWISLGDQLGATKYYDSSIDRTLRIWDFENAVDWASELEVAAP